jgi:deoxyinosine 3'endonuclease (endonuclease V)
MAEYKTLKLTGEMRKLNHEITQWIKLSKYNLDIHFEYIGNLDIRFESHEEFYANTVVMNILKVMLVTLQILHIFWTILIIKTAATKFNGGKVSWNINT